MNDITSLPAVLGSHQSDIFKATAEYIAQDWHVLPLHPQKGLCYMDKSEQDAFMCSAIEVPVKFAGSDVGVDLHRSGLAGVDVDCVEAAAFLQAFLPPTGIIGREGKAVSWMLYESSGISTSLSFKDCNESGTAASEVGGIKGKAVVALPPSRHRKSYEVLNWTGGKSPAVIDADQLVKVASRCFALTLIARRWPQAGNRHESTLALAGALLLSGWPLDESICAVKVLAKVTKDPKQSDRLGEVKSTYQRHAEGKDISGLPRLVQLLDPKPVCQQYLEKMLRTWLGGDSATEALGQGAGQGAGELVPLSKHVLSVTDLLKLDLPEPDFIVDPWLPAQGLINLFASRGVGKTWACLELAVSVALGRDFYKWPVTKPRHVLYVDGEMPLGMLQWRLRQLLGSNHPPTGLKLLSSQILWRDNAGLNINKPDQQKRVDDYLDSLEKAEEKPELIIFDNLSSLATGVEENSNSEQDALLLWLVKLRSRGYAVMIVSHAGKNGENRGASRREDFMDTVIKLESKDGIDLKKSSGACFDISFSKIRGERPNPLKLTVALSSDPDGNLLWEYEETQEVPAYLKLVQVIDEHKPNTQADLTKILGISKQAISAQVKIAEQKGLVTKSPLSLTQKGVEAISLLSHDTSALAGAL